MLILAVIIIIIFCHSHSDERSLVHVFKLSNMGFVLNFDYFKKSFSI